MGNSWSTAWGKNMMAGRIGFETLNAGPCTGLHGLVQTQETKHLSGLQFPLDIIGLFSELICTDDGARRTKWLNAFSSISRGRIQARHFNFVYRNFLRHIGGSL